jgi:hypothetical protein
MDQSRTPNAERRTPNAERRTTELRVVYVILDPEPERSGSNPHFSHQNFACGESRIFSKFKWCSMEFHFKIFS